MPLKLSTKLVKYVFDSVYLHIPNDKMKIISKNSEFSHKISLGKIATVGQISLFSTLCHEVILLDLKPPRQIPKKDLYSSN